MITGFFESNFAWAAIPVGLLLIALYVWFQRSHQRNVSALFLWDQPEQRVQTGKTLRFQKFPLSFWLELIIFALLIFALMRPYVVPPTSLPKLVVILDNSYSMQAKVMHASQEQTVKSVGEAELLKRIRSMPKREVVYCLAGAEPRWLSESLTFNAVCEVWVADDSTADLQGAIARSKLHHPNAQILVITDSPPAGHLTDDISWLSFGASHGNAAIVNARRSGNSLLVELMNTEATDITGELVMSPGDFTQRVHIPSNEIKKVRVKLKPGWSTFDLKLDFHVASDPLVYDNTMHVLAERPQDIVYAFDSTLSDAAKIKCHRVLSVNPSYVMTEDVDSAHFIIGGQDMKRRIGAHHLFWITGIGANARATVEPISVRGESLLMRGLHFDDVIWSADPNAELPESLLVQRGQTPLFAMNHLYGEGVDFYINMVPENSTIERYPVWPSLFCNIAQALHEELPGVMRANWKRHEVIRCNLPIRESHEQLLTVTSPRGKHTDYRATDGKVYLSNLSTGLSVLTSGKETWRVSVSSVNVAESDLTQTARYSKVTRVEEHAQRPVYRSLCFIPLLLALVVLMYHQHRLGENGGRNECA